MVFPYGGRRDKNGSLRIPLPSFLWHSCTWWSHWVVQKRGVKRRIILYFGVFEIFTMNVKGSLKRSNAERLKWNWEDKLKENYNFDITIIKSTVKIIFSMDKNNNCSKVILTYNTQEGLLVVLPSEITWPLFWANRIGWISPSMQMIMFLIQNQLWSLSWNTLTFWNNAQRKREISNERDLDKAYVVPWLHLLYLAEASNLEETSSSSSVAGVSFPSTTRVCSSWWHVPTMLHYLQGWVFIFDLTIPKNRLNWP